MLFPLLCASAHSDYTVRVVAPTKTVPAKRGARQSGVHSGVNTAWTERRVRGVRILQVPALAKLPWLVHGFSTRPGGVSDPGGEKVLNLGFTECDNRENVLENRRRFQSALGASDVELIPLTQIHSDVIHLFDVAPARQGPTNTGFLDLRKATCSQLLRTGLPPPNIFVSDQFTACRRHLLFSYRKEGPHSGRLLSVIGLRSSQS